MRILCVHGIGHQEEHTDGWQPYWTSAIVNALGGNPFEMVHRVDYLAYDDLFEGPISRLSYGDYAQAFARLAGGVLARKEARFVFDEQAKWYVGMVACWINNKDLCYQLNTRLIEKVDNFGPDIVIAHSLGSLIAYDTFAHFTDADAIKGRTLITLGAQIGNPFVARGVFNGVNPLPSLKRWWHLFNANDHVFTAPLDSIAFRDGQNYTQINTTFGDVLGAFSANHAAVNPSDTDNAYLTHPATREMWKTLAAEANRG